MSPDDPAARCARRGQVTRWAGYLAHVTETCAVDAPNVITDVAALPAASADSLALDGDPRPAGPPGPAPGRAPARRRVHLPGPHAAGRARAPGRPHRAAARQPHPPAPRPARRRPRGFRTGFDRQEVTCPQGQVSKGWHGPCPTSSPDAAPLIVAKFTRSQRQPCPAKAACTTSGDGKRTVGFPPRERYELQARNRADQQDPARHKRYAVRSGVEGTVCEVANGHGMRHCRYRGQPNAHLQHVLTATAVNIERLSQPPPGENPAPRPPTAFQDYLDQHAIQRPRTWRAVS